MIFGNDIFSIESNITEAYIDPGIRGVGYFTISLFKMRYGVYEKDATCLACSFDSIQERIKMKGTHVSYEHFMQGDALEIGKAVRASLYEEVDEENTFFGIAADNIRNSIYEKQLLMAPDGDSAFDDSSYILHFDLDEDVRLIGFKCQDGGQIATETLRDVHIPAVVFYSILSDWRDAFMEEWTVMEKNTS